MFSFLVFPEISLPKRGKDTEALGYIRKNDAFESLTKKPLNWVRFGLEMYEIRVCFVRTVGVCTHRPARSAGEEITMVLRGGSDQSSNIMAPPTLQHFFPLVVEVCDFLYIINETKRNSSNCRC